MSRNKDAKDRRRYGTPQPQQQKPKPPVHLREVTDEEREKYRIPVYDYILP